MGVCFLLHDVVVLTVDDVVALRETAEAIADLAERTLDACTEFAATLGRSTDADVSDKSD